MWSNKRDKNQFVYVRPQQGHSIILHLAFGWMVGYINVIYITGSPRHYWHW